MWTAVGGTEQRLNAEQISLHEARAQQTINKGMTTQNALMVEFARHLVSLPAESLLLKLLCMDFICLTCLRLILKMWMYANSINAQGSCSKTLTFMATNTFSACFFFVSAMGRKLRMKGMTHTTRGKSQPVTSSLIVDFRGTRSVYLKGNTTAMYLSMVRKQRLVTEM